MTGSALAAATALDNNKAADNPLYSFWKGQEGKSVRFNRSELISGGAPIAGVRPAVTSLVTYALSEFTTKQAVVEVITDENALGNIPVLGSSIDFVLVETLTIPAKLMPEDPGFPKVVGSEELKINDKTPTPQIPRLKWAAMGRDCAAK